MKMAPINFPEARQAAPAPAALSSSTIIGIAVSGACVIILIASLTIYLLIRKRRQHRLAMSELENRIPTHQQMTEQAPRPVSGIRCGRLVPLPESQAGWDALGSSDTIDRPQPVKKKRRGSVKVPKRMALRKWRHLSAIMESPRSKNSTLQPGESVTEMIGSPGKLSIRRVGEPVLLGESPFAAPPPPAPGSPRPEVLPSFAIKSPARYGAAIANDEDEKRPFVAAMRSVSTGVLDADGAVFGETCHPAFRRLRPEMHARSISLGAPTTKPPSGPLPVLPPLPKINTNLNMRSGLCVSRMSSDSSSSVASAGSSVLVTSPILNRQDDSQPLSSPTVEEIVAENDNAELKSVANRQWHNPRVAGPRHNNPMRIEKPRGSIRANIVRASTDSALTRQLSSASTASSEHNRLSIPQFGTADIVSVSRVSSSNSLIQKVETPPRRHSHRRSQVSANGSPSERKKKNGVLRDISGNASKPSPRRQMSISTQDSGTSSNGNPFHWENGSASSLSKPSALKGSPNARKGHRRQNCVRISTLMPQVLGPPRSRSASPAGIMMDEIAEERESDELKRESSERKEVERAVAQERRRSRPPMPNRTTSSESNLRIQTLRASLTPSSPTLSTWNPYNEVPGLPSQPSDMSMSALSASPYHRSESRQSNHSALVIPKFPTPAKARASVALSQIDTAPMPQFSLDMESPVLGFDDRKASEPFALDMSSDGPTPVSPNDNSPVEFSPVSPLDLPSSPPLPISKTKEYDPAWPMVKLPTPKDEYDPASPPLVWTDDNSDHNEERSSYFLPFAVSDLDADEISPKSRPTSYISSAREDEIPVSPKTVLQEFQPSAETRAQREKLTSENASSIMARMPGKSLSTSSFLGGAEMPVLSPPDSGYADLPLPQWQPQQPAPVANMGHTRQRSVSNVNFKPPRTGPPAPALPTIPQSDDSPPPATVPEPLHIAAENKTGPKGPRSAPGKSVLRNAMALRRMNSEVRCDKARESRNYVRLGREASPLLPWCPNDSESCNDLFDFDFDTRGGAADTDEERTPTRASAMDEIDPAAIEKNIEGALAGFDAEYRAWPNPYEAPALSRSSSVWEDGEKFWDERPATAQSLQLPQFQYAHTGEQTPSRRHEEKTLDPRLLSTPVSSRYDSSPVSKVGAATPKSLYDADGFLKS